MSKVRVYELARDIGVQSKELVDFLADLGADIKNHMSTIDEEIAKLVRAHFSQDDEVVEEIEEPKPARKKPQPRAEETRKARPTPARTDGDSDGKEEKPSRAQRRHQRNGKKPAQKSATQKPVQKTSDRPERSERRTEGKEEGRRGSIEIPDALTVAEFADKLGIPATAIIKNLMQAGIMASINQSIDHDAAALVAQKLGFEVSRPEKEKEGPLFGEEDAPETLVLRPPVVTIMGHVDHGKTTLLDTIRKSKIVETEAGGITQHIGAYQVELDGRKITFLDTPGHEAFTAMRSRGAQITDEAILVVAADDGVMPQTVEAINHAQAAGVPVIVAINKMDRPGANPDRIKQQLSEHNLLPEDWGGDTIMVPISALKNEGIEDLLEMILLVAEMKELKANPGRPARGTIVEAELDKGRGPVATVLVETGTLRIGDAVVAGPIAGKVRAMISDKGEFVQEAGPSVPVEVLGLSEVPAAGDLFEVAPDDRTARQIADERQTRMREAEIQRGSRVRLNELFSKIKEGEVKDLNLLIKADVQGSVEALRGALEKLDSDEVRINIIHAGAGGVTESDVNLAAASNAIIIGFNVRPETTARRAAEREDVDVRLYRVIYEIVEDIEAAMKGMLDPEFEEVVHGRAEVRATFRVPNAGTVAGCYVTEGRIMRSAQMRLLRDSVVIHEGQISSLRRFKDDVREVAQGYECGIGIERYNDIKEGDVLEAFTMEEVER